jgi:DNA repair exonuclease SbcCD ATPase subunit
MDQRKSPAFLCQMNNCFDDVQDLPKAIKQLTDENKRLEEAIKQRTDQNKRLKEALERERSTNAENLPGWNASAMTRSRKDYHRKQVVERLLKSLKTGREKMEALVDVGNTRADQVRRREDRLREVWSEIDSERRELAAIFSFSEDHIEPSIPISDRHFTQSTV